MDQTPDARLSGANEVLQRAGLEPVVRHLGAIGQSVGDGHKNLRAEERARALDIPFGRGMQAVAERDFGAAHVHARQAREHLKAQRNNEAWKSLKKGLGPRKADVERSLSQARGYWVEAIHRADYSAADAVEVAGIWDAAVDAWKKHGVDGVFDHLDKHFAEVESSLTSDQDFGRHPHSPLQTWQWILIGVIVGIGVAAVLACLFWSGCAWIYQIFVALCWGTGAVGGWVGICLGFTF
jgi:hypothetical protein